MTSIIERGVNLCFTEDILQTVALDILRNSNFTDNPKSLRFLSLKSIMTRKMKKKNIYSNLIFSLIFREPVKIENFNIRFEIYHSWFEKMRTKMLRFITGDPEKIFLQLRTDPIIMQAVFQQNITNTMYKCVWIHLHRNFLEIRLPNGIYPMDVQLEKDYDTYWAGVFLRTFLAKSLQFVTIKMEGQGNYTLEDMQNHLKPMFANLNPIIPPEGWKEAIENGKQPIYSRWPDAFHNRKTYTVTFEVDKTGKFKKHSSSYWGYLEDKL